MIEFTKVLAECLERIRQGDSVQSCLEAHSQHALQLQPYLASAASLRGLRTSAAPEARARARNRLMESIAAGSGKEEAVFGVFKFAHVIGAVVGALFLMSVGIVAAAGGPEGLNPFGGADKHDVQTFEFKGEVVDTGEQHLVILSGDDEVSFVVTDDTAFRDAGGNEIDGVEKGDKVTVVAKKDGDDLVALKVRLASDDAVLKPSATPKPTQAPAETPKPAEPTKPADGPAPPAASTTKVYEGYVKGVGDGTFLLKQADYTLVTIHVDSNTVIEGSLAPGCTARVEAVVYSSGVIVATHITCPPPLIEFSGVVASMGDGFMVLNIDSGQVQVFWGPDTYWSGEPFAGVKVLVKATQNPDGTFLAAKIIVKTAEISGTVASIGTESMTVSTPDGTFTVKWNGETVWQGPSLYVGAPVWVAAYKMGDGTFLATKIVVKSPSFTGAVTAHMPGEFTIHVQVGDVTKVVSYEFADVVGTPDVGKTVYVEVDHEEGGTYFASLVKVIS